MRAWRLSSLLLLSWCVLFGQLDSNSITIRTSRTLNLQRDQLLLDVGVAAAQTAGLEDILSALPGSGVAATDLTSVSSAIIYIGTGLPPSASMLRWAFSWAVPFGKVGATVEALKTVQKTIMKTGWSLTYGSNGTQASPQSLASQQCSIPDLLVDARAQASMLANAAGLTAGAIVALSDDSGTGRFGFATAPQYALLLVPSVSFRSGDFSSYSSGSFSFGSSPVSNVYCSMVVKFQLLRYQ